MRRCIAALAAVLALGIVSCGDDDEGTTETVVVTETESTTAPLPFSRYASAKFTAEIPEGWTIEGGNDVDKGTYHETKWVSPGDSNIFVLVNVNDEPIQSTPAESAAQVRQGLTSGDNSYEELGFEQVSFNRHVAFKWEFRNEGDQRVDYFFNQCEPAIGFAVLGSAPPEKFPTVAATFEHVAQSISASCPTAPPTPKPKPKPPVQPQRCEPAYPSPPGPCLPLFSGDPSAIDCPELQAQGFYNFPANPPDPYHLDGSPPEQGGSPNFEPPDGDACEPPP